MALKVALVCGKFSTGLHGQIDAEHLFESRALTGSESSFLNVARGLKELGHNVDVFCDAVKEIQNCERLSGANVLHIDRDIPGDYDAYISLNEPDQFRRLPINTKGLRIVQQQLNDFPYCAEGFDNFVDIYAFLAPVHKQHLLSITPQISPEKAWWIPNSINLDISQKFIALPKVPHSMAWCSSPDRGLHRLLEMWPDIRRRLPEATLKIFYRFDPWYEAYKDAHTKTGARARYIGECLNVLGRNGENGVTLVGAIPNVKLAEELARTEILPYTCDCISFTEGFSVSIMDAAIAGAVPIISDTDAIGDIYRNVAVVLPAKPGDHIETWVNEIARVSTEPTYRQSIRDRCQKFAIRFSRQNVAQLWEELITSNLNRLEKPDFSRLPRNITDYATPVISTKAWAQNKIEETLRASRPGQIVSAYSIYQSLTTEEQGIGENIGEKAELLHALGSELERRFGNSKKRGKNFAFPDGNEITLEHEKDVQAWVKESIKEGDVFWDVGAHRGLMSQVALEAGARKIVAFECNPSVFQRLVEDMPVSSKATCILAAVNSKSNELFNLTIFPDNAGICRAAPEVIPYCPVGSVVSQQHEIWIPTITLDEVLLKGASQPDVIKIDIEGGDYDCLLGAEEVLKKVRVVLIECANGNLSLRNRNETDVIDFLEARGFKTERSIENPGNMIARRTSDKSIPETPTPPAISPHIFHKKKPLVSIIMPAYRPGGLDITFAGLHDQTFKDFEFILVDNRYEQRQKGVQEISRALDINTIHTPEHRKNGKWIVFCAAVNTAIALARGKYVFFLHDFTYVPPGWIEAHLALHEVNMGSKNYVTGDNQHVDLPEVVFKRDYHHHTDMNEANRSKTTIDEIFSGGYLDEICFFKNGHFNKSWLPLPIGPQQWQSGLTDMYKAGMKPDFQWPHLSNDSIEREFLLELNGLDERYDFCRSVADQNFAARVVIAGGTIRWLDFPPVSLLNPRFLARTLPYGSDLERIDGRWNTQDGKDYNHRVIDSKNSFADNPYNLRNLSVELEPWRNEDAIRVPRDISDLAYWRRIVRPETPPLIIT